MTRASARPRSTHRPRRAQSERVDELLARFGTDTAIHSDDLGWMEGITDERLLPKLFEALLASYEHPNPDGWNDSMGPISEAIRRVDGPDAIARYDAILAADPPPFSGAHDGFDLIVVVDTSQFHGDPRMRRRNFRNLVRQHARGQFQLTISEVVLRERV